MLAIRWVLSLIFIIQMYLAMAVVAIGFAPFALFSRAAAVKACHVYCQWVIFSLRILCGLRCEVRGTPPTDEVVIAGKHQSFLDIILIYSAVPRGKFIMKRELMWTPFLGQYARRIGCVPVNRGKRGAAIAKMKADVMAGSEFPGQLIIYPQGTRVAPGVPRPYKVGTGALYEQLGQPCVPVAACCASLVRSVRSRASTCICMRPEPVRCRSSCCPGACRRGRWCGCARVPHRSRRRGR